MNHLLLAAGLLLILPVSARQGHAQDREAAGQKSLATASTRVNALVSLRGSGEENVLSRSVGPSRRAGVQETPDPRAHHQVVYHAGEQRVYLLGGSTRRGDTYHYFNDVWYWNGTNWVRDDPLPFPRSSHRVVYHGGRNSLVLFGGGSDETFAADGALWEWRGDDWRALAGGPNAGRAEPGMCYDRRRRRIVVFGGWDSSDRFAGTTCEWTGEGLVAADSTGPSPRAGHAFVYDPKRERCLLFGGRGDGGYLSDTWEWDGAEWRRLDASGPSARWFFGSATDDANGRIVIFGGSGPEGDLGDTWAWDGDGWVLLSRDGPAPRGMAKLAFDGTHVLLFGGRAQTSEGFRDLNDTWELQAGAWTQRQ